MNHYNIPIFIPHAACPYQCVFCNQKKISGQLNIPSINDIENTINNHLLTLPKENAFIEIGFFGGSFTAIPFQEQEKYLKIASKYINRGVVKEIRVSTRPDFIDDNELNLLKKYGLQTIELGAQSMDEQVLAHSGRGHKVEDIVNASVLIKNAGFNLGLQMMIGLPFDTIEKAKQTAKQIISLQADCTRIYPTLVIKDTALELLYQQNKYFPLSIEDAVEWTKEIYNIFVNSNTKVIRIGLHPSEGLMKGDSLIAGPFHPSFKELVLTQIWNDLFKKIKNEKKLKKITIFVAKEQLNYAIGYNSTNKIELLKFYSFVVFKTDNSLKGNNFYVNYN
ncbi:MAG: hypothetical protein AUJ97_03315 [Bacteroidetes bacterium CG2_30_32_10]|nr:MAG: hypothetical protein AUJ97_03315 [Bacteroidetes bacterium CG2_30_32_10]